MTAPQALPWLESFQQCIRRIAIQPIGRRDDCDLGTGAMTGQAQIFDQLTYLIDANLLGSQSGYAIWVLRSRVAPGPSALTLLAPWAKAGLKRLDIQYVRQELAPWLESDSPGSQMLWQAVDQLRSLDEDELQFVARHLFGLGDAATQTIFREVVRQSAEQSSRELATELIERLWPAGWEQVFRSRFQQIVDSAPKVPVVPVTSTPKSPGTSGD